MYSMCIALLNTLRLENWTINQWRKSNLSPPIIRLFACNCNDNFNIYRKFTQYYFNGIQCARRGDLPNDEKFIRGYELHFDLWTPPKIMCNHKLCSSNFNSFCKQFADSEREFLIVHVCYATVNRMWSKLIRNLSTSMLKYFWRALLLHIALAWRAKSDNFSFSNTWFCSGMQFIWGSAVCMSVFCLLNNWW